MKRAHHLGEPSLSCLLRFCFHQGVFHIHHGQHLIDLIGRIFLHPRHHVRVGVEGQADVRVTQPLLDHLRMDVLLQHDRRCRVAKIVEADVRKAGDI